MKEGRLEENKKYNLTLIIIVFCVLYKTHLLSCLLLYVGMSCVNIFLAKMVHGQNIWETLV
jgi:hypothetical protein